jgi:glycosyltransferase involved in cell wall biosynthesis
MGKLNMRVTICGNTGQRTGLMDGQTYRTRLVHEELARRLGQESVGLVDTSYMMRRPIRTVLAMKRGYDACDVFIVMPGSNGLYVFSYLLKKWRKRSAKPIHYLVVGGWLPKFLERHKRLRKFCESLDGLYVQTESMVHRLEALGLTNVRLLSNFRYFERQAPSSQLMPRDTGGPLKACFFSRVMKAKGVEAAMEACRRANKRAGKRIITLDIFGQVAKAFGDEFGKLRERYPEHEYRGVLPAENPYTTLREYDIMLFPTFYGGEGFPGAVLDAFIAGLPVIASDWLYNSEVIDDGRTGLLFKVNQVEELEARIHELVNNPDLLQTMKQNVKVEAQRYHTDVVFPRLLAQMKMTESRTDQAVQGANG